MKTPWTRNALSALGKITNFVGSIEAAAEAIGMPIDDTDFLYGPQGGQILKKALLLHLGLGSFAAQPLVESQRIVVISPMLLRDLSEQYVIDGRLERILKSQSFELSTPTLISTTGRGLAFKHPVTLTEAVRRIQECWKLCSIIEALALASHYDECSGSVMIPINENECVVIWSRQRKVRRLTLEQPGKLSQFIDPGSPAKIYFKVS